MPPVPVSQSQIDRLVKRWFPDQVVVVERMGRGVSTPVYRLVVAGNVHYLRLAEEPGEDRLGEVTAHRLALAAGVSVPTVVRFETAPPELDRSAALTSNMPGVSLTEWGNPVPDRTITAVAADLVRFNAIPVRGYGWIDGVSDDDVLFAQHATRAAWVADYEAMLERVTAAGVFPPAVATRLTRAMRVWEALPEQGSAHLAHGDFDANHIYVDSVSGEYQGLIDLGEIRGADPLYDLGHLLAHAFDPASLDVAGRVIERSSAILPFDREEVRLQAIAIATRALGIQLSRSPNTYRTRLIARLTELLSSSPSVC